MRFIALAGLALLAVLAPAQKSEPVEIKAGWIMADAEKVGDDGAKISQSQGLSSDWMRAIVPGTVLTTLVADGVYPDPLFGENNRPDRIPDDLSTHQFWYRDEFQTPSFPAGRHVWLNFGGINYFADVWLNGHELGWIKGAFTRGRFEVTPYLVKSGSNVLAVKIVPPPDPGETHEKTQANGTGRNGGILAKDGPTFLCSIGWDWIPTIRDRNMGIWQSVSLEASGPVLLQDPYVDSKLPLPSTNSADLTVCAYVRNVTDQAQSGTFKASVGNVQVSLPVTVPPGETLTVTAPQIHVRNPKLWWPNGFGPQNLTRLKTEFDINGGVSDSKEIEFGIRQIGYSVPSSPNLTLTVNGVPVVAKGGDWGMDEAMKRIPRSRLDAMIRMHRDANYTIIRNWVGQSTSDAFYDLCDRYGILVWDEFFQPNPSDGPNPVDPELYLANVREKILRYRYHPCIALWCARNEGNPPANIGDGIQKLIDELDSTRLYQASSTDGRGVRSGGPYHWRTPKEFYSFDEPFKTEIGSMSVPTLESIKAMMPAADWTKIDDDWAEHDFCGGAQDGSDYPYEISDRYGAPVSLADFVRKSQLANFEAYRAMYEGRLCKLFKPTSGVITWMSNPAQPSFVWQLYAHDLEPNASLFGTKSACEPVHAMLNESTGHLMAINNTADAYPSARLRAVVYNLMGAVRQSLTVKVDLGPCGVADAGELGANEEGLSEVYFVELQLTSAKGKLLSRNFYWRAKSGHPDDLSGLNALPQVPLAISTSQHGGSVCTVTATLRNPSHAVALMAHLQLRTLGSRQRVLPVFYSDNYVSLVPGETKTISIETDRANLGGESPLLEVDGWNVTVGDSSGAVRAIANADACVKPSAIATAAPLSHVRIDCGSRATGDYVFGQADSAETTRDRFYTGGYAIGVRGTVAGDDGAYRAARVLPSTYSIPVDRQFRYKVTLRFAETRLQPGARKFNVSINGKPVLKDFDIAADVGIGKADEKSFPAVQPNAAGQIVIEFSKGSADQPIISGIEVSKQS